MSNINNRNGDDIIEQNMIGPVERLILKTQEIQNKRYQLNNSFLELIKLNKECEKKKITINEIIDAIKKIIDKAIPAIFNLEILWEETLLISFLSFND